MTTGNGRVHARSAPPRAGVTLVELMVVVALLGISAAIVVMAWRPSRTTAETIAARLEGARQQALRTGVSVHITIVDSLGAHELTAIPDGSVTADPALGIDRLSGRIAPAGGATSGMSHARP